MEIKNSNWIQQIELKNSDLLKKTIQEPFIQELITGKLSQKRFLFYIQQDAIYINTFTTLLAKLAKRIEAPKYKLYFENFIQENMEEEKELHKHYLKATKLTDISPIGACLSLLQFNKELAEHPYIEVAIAGILPCFMIYQQLGTYIYNKHIKDNHPYSMWINTYAGAEHAASVHKIQEIYEDYTNNATPSRRIQMDEYYRKGVLLDQLFWRGCYNMQ